MKGYPIKSTSKSKKPARGPTIQRGLKFELLGLALFTLAALATATFFTASLGALGNLGGRALSATAGSGRYVLPLLLFLLGLHFLKERCFKLSPKMLGAAFLFMALVTFLHLRLVPGNYFSAGWEGLGGGVTGAAGAALLTRCFGLTGSYILLVSLSIAGVILLTGTSLAKMGMAAALRTKTTGSKAWQKIFNFVFEEYNREPAEKCSDPKRARSKNNGKLNAAGDMGAQQPEAAPTGDRSSKEEPADIAEEVKLEAYPLALSDGRVYMLPQPDLLSGSKLTKSVSAGKDIPERTRKLEETLASFGIGAKVTEVSVGPAITRFELQPPPGVKVSRIVGLADDIALSLAAPGVRIEAPIPGKAAVGIEVPNIEISPVQLRELLESKEFTAPASRLSIALGKDIAGNPIVSDLGKMPHLLVAGATGSGKSVCINTLICSILFRATPDEVKFLMVDPKMVELTTYNGIPHLISPVVTDAKKAAGTLRWAVKEMERRYELFAAAGVRDIGRYNGFCLEQKNEENSLLSYIVIIIDELADLMMVAPADVEDSICRLAQMARAAGMHLVVATQRPSVDVITGLIKANIPSRISFAVSSQTDSRTILDMGGAEKLLGKGDMLFFPVGAPKPVRVQGAFLTDSDVEKLVDFLKEQGKPVYDEQVLNAAPAAGTRLQAEEIDDELLAQAVQLFIESGTASISLLQRRLHIGYARAARLVDIMEQKNIVGAFEGSKPRSILMTLDQYRQVFKKTGS